MNKAILRKDIEHHKKEISIYIKYILLTFVLFFTIFSFKMIKTIWSEVNLLDYNMVEYTKCTKSFTEGGDDGEGSNGISVCEESITVTVSFLTRLTQHLISSSQIPLILLIIETYMITKEYLTMKEKQKKL